MHFETVFAFIKLHALNNEIQSVSLFIIIVIQTYIFVNTDFLTVRFISENTSSIGLIW